MKLKTYFTSITAFVLAFTLLSASLPVVGYASTPAGIRTDESDIEERLARIEAKIVERQKKLGIPGLSIAIVKDGKILLSKGFGYKDFE